MKRIHHILYFIVLMGCMVACDDDLGIQVIPEGEPVEIVIPYGSADNLDIHVGTRATLPPEAEKKIYNFYIYIFDDQGHKVYGHYFDSKNFNNNNLSNYWESSNNDFSAGTIHIKTYAKDNCTLYAIANIDADMVNISPEKLGRIQTKTDVENLVATMNQNTVSRSGYFPMSGGIKNVNTANLSGVTLQMKRLDARIMFKVQIGDPAAGKQEIEEFIPETWQVFNVPSSSYVLGGRSTSVPDKSYFNTEAVNFEETKIEKSGKKTHHFSFYMLENMYTSPTQLTSMAQRSEQIKDAQHKNGAWKYASPTSTYVVVEGRIIMQNPVSTGLRPGEEAGTTIGKTLNADVRYVIHLGNFAQNLSDYNTLRNTQYTYTITIRGVDDIRVEVETSETTNTENAPAATGSVTIAKEEIYDCDAHYSSQVLTFHQKNINPETVTWYVKTPFCEGRPQVIEGADVPIGLDYEWVHFQINDKDADGLYYQDRRRKYDRLNCMDVIELVDYLRKQKRNFDNNMPNDFDKGTGNDDQKICVTVHVDEYYYEKNPITGKAEKDLWKKFVNQPMRLMHILSDSQHSLDGESMIVGSSSTIQQKSIQSIYNEDNPDLHSAWGCEYWDEYPDLWEYSEYAPNAKTEYRGNTDLANGRLNSCKEWGLCDTYGTQFKVGGKWDDYVDFEVNNATPLLKENHRYLRYSCLTRNRDNNNDGIIDEDEVRWYMASVRQLIGIWMGADGIGNDARLYRRTGNEKGQNWRQHVISSTLFNNNSNDPTIIWAEEGSSTGNLSYSWDHVYAGANRIYSIRCIRNLGHDAANGNKDFTHSPIANVPTDYVDVDDSQADSQGTYTINLTHLNEKSIRYFTSRELDHSNENSMQNRLYKKFEVAPANAHPNINPKIGNIQLNEELNNIITENPYCPPGYRVPNQREITLMAYYLPKGYWNGCECALTRTLYSFGYFEQRNPNVGTDILDQVGWLYNVGTNNVHMSKTTDYTTTHIRCVRDVE